MIDSQIQINDLVHPSVRSLKAWYSCSVKPGSGLTMFKNNDYLCLLVDDRNSAAAYCSRTTFS